MCRTVHAVLSAIICGIQAIVRVVMTTLLMLENLVRMFLQTFYNFLSFLLQLFSLIPICCVFLITSRMKCFMCGGGGPCPVNRGGACDCLMSLIAIIILFLIFRATGVLDKIFYSIGYAKATTRIVRFSPTTGSVTECSRNATGQYYDYETTEPGETTEGLTGTGSANFLRNLFEYYDDELMPNEKSYEGREGAGDGNNKYVDYLYDKLHKQDADKSNKQGEEHGESKQVSDKKVVDLKVDLRAGKQDANENEAESGRRMDSYAMTTILYYLA